MRNNNIWDGFIFALVTGLIFTLSIISLICFIKFLYLFVTVVMVDLIIMISELIMVLI